MKKVTECLFITTSYPPYPESQTIRNVFFINGLIKAGFSVTVLTSLADSNGDALLEKLVHPGVRVLRTNRTPYHRLQALVAKVHGSPFLHRRLRSLAAVLFGKIMAPDVWAGWQGQAFGIAVEAIAGGLKPSVVVSSSGSFTAHIAAARLAKRFSIPWVAEYGDPWYLNPLAAKSPWITAMNYWWEKQALKQCSGMTVTTQETARLYQDWLGQEVPEIAVVPCGFYRDSGQVALAHPAANKLHIAYVGSASATNRDLGQFMKILGQSLSGAQNREVLFRIIGSSSPVFESAAKGYASFRTEFSGWVTYTRSIEEMNEATVLVLIGNKSRSQIPGKVYQYMAAGRPIVYLSQLPDGDPTDELLRRHAGVVHLKIGDAENPARLRKFIDNLSTLQAAALVSANVEGYSQSYSWQALGDAFTGFVKSRLV
jgi:hypothetical protein